MNRLFALLLRLPRWTLTALCTAAIVYLTLVPKPLPDNDIQFWEHTDKIVHAIMFGGLYFCVALDLWRGKRPPTRRIWAPALSVAAFGALIEILQQSMGMGRGGSLGDFAADVTGVALTVLTLSCIQNRQARRP